jgi:ankyrin repeat protein
MAEPRAPAVTLGCLFAGLALALLPSWLASRWALPGLLLAQPLLVLAWGGWRGRTHGTPPTPWWQDLLALLLLWTLAFALTTLLLAWPLLALRETGALVPALLLSACGGFVLIALWRLWPAFASAARSAHAFPELVAIAARGGPAPHRLGPCCWPSWSARCWRLACCWPGQACCRRRCAGPCCSPSRCCRCSRMRSLHSLAAIALAAPKPGNANIGAGDSAPTGEPAPPPEDADEALYAALRSGRVDAALAALAAGANAHALPASGERDQRNLPMLAALQGDLRALRQLIARGVDLNQAFAGMTPLLAATRDSWHGRPEAVMTLLANGADARATDNEGNTPLHHAARSTDPAVAALLLDAGAHVDAINGEGHSPLAIACGSGNWRLARFLIEHGARPEPVGGEPALLAAVSGDDDPGGAQLLLRHKARVDARGAEHRTALLQACASGNVDIAGVLLEAGADRNAQDEHGMTPLLEAAHHGHGAVVARLAASKPNARAVDAQQRNALMLACLGGAAPELLQQLLALGVDPQQVDAEGRRAIDVAIAHGRWPQVAVLDPEYALPATVAEGLADGQLLRSPRDLLREALSAAAAGGSRSPARARHAGQRLAVGAAGGFLRRRTDRRPSTGCCATALPPMRATAIATACCSSCSRRARGGAAAPARSRPGGRRPGGLSRFLHGCQRSERTSRGTEQLALSLLERGADAFGAPPAAKRRCCSRSGWAGSA